MTKSEERKKFRNLKVWKTFRESEIEKRGCKCEICGKLLTKVIGNLHHRFRCDSIEEYSNLDPKRFLLLCTNCHDWVHVVANSPVLKKYKLANLKEVDEPVEVDIADKLSK